MTAQIFRNPKAAMPIDFRLFCGDHVNALFSMGSPQTLTLEITNTSQANLTIPGHFDGEVDTDSGALALVFRPGVLNLSGRQKFDAMQGEICEWIAKVKQDPGDLSDRILLTPATTQTLGPGQSVGLTIKDVSALSSGNGSHGTLVALESVHLLQKGTQGRLSVIATQRVDVLHQIPIDLNRLDDLIDTREQTLQGISEQQQTIERTLAKLRDAALVPLQADVLGTPLLAAGRKSEVVIRMAPKPAADDSDGLDHVWLPKGTRITVSTDEPGVSLSEIGPRNIGLQSGRQKGGKSSDTDASVSFVTSKGLRFRKKEGGPRPIYAVGLMVAPQAGLQTTATLNVSVSGASLQMPRRDNAGKLQFTPGGQPRYTKKALEDISMSVAVQIGSLRPHKDGLDVSGALTLKGELTLTDRTADEASTQKHPRLYQDLGWNFTLPINHKSDSKYDRALRVGPADAADNDGLDAFRVTTRETSVGSISRDQDARFRVASSKDKLSIIDFSNGKHSFEIKGKKDALTIGPKGKTSLTIKQADGRIGIGTQPTENQLEVAGTTNVDNLKAKTLGVTDTLTANKLHAKDTSELRGELKIGKNAVSMHFGKEAKQGDSKGFAPSTEDGFFIETISDGESSGIFMNGQGISLWNPGDEDLLRIFDEDEMVGKKGYGEGGGSEFDGPKPKLRLTNSGDLYTEGGINAGNDMNVAGKLTVGANATIKGDLILKGILKGKPGLNQHYQKGGEANSLWNGRIGFSGYQLIGNFMIQWGVAYSDEDVEQTFYFKKAFRTIFYMLATRREGDANLGVHQYENTHFVLQRYDKIDKTAHVDWIAFGSV